MHVATNTKIIATVFLVLAAVLISGPFSKKADLDISGEAARLFRHQKPGEDVKDYLNSQASVCRSNKIPRCYYFLSNLLLQQFKTSEILTALKDAENYPAVFSRCHELAHFLGRKTYEITGSVPKAYEAANEACWGGYYHGVMEGYLYDQSLSWDELTDVNVAKSISGVCGVKSDYRLERFYHECVHGIGHALMFITDSEVPRSLSLCDALDSHNEAVVCYGGVFMENSSSSTNVDHPSKYLQKDDPSYPCTILDEKYLPECYRFQSSYFAEVANWDWGKTAQMCLQVPEAYRDECIYTVGSNQVGNTQSVDTMISNCNSVSQTIYKRECYKGVISGLTGRYIEDTAPVQKFCGLVGVSDREYCWAEVIYHVKTWTNNRELRAKHCEFLAKEENLYSVCLN